MSAPSLPEARVSAPSLSDASVAMRRALDTLTRAHREAADAAAALANHIALGLPLDDAERSHRNAESACLGAAVVVSETRASFRNALAHARRAGEVA